MWEGTNNDGKKWLASIDETRRTLSVIFLGGGGVYECSLEDFIHGKKVAFQPEAIQQDILAAAIAANEKGIQLRRVPTGGWACIGDCALCGDWPNDLHHDMSTTSGATDDRFPDAVEKLVLIFGHRSYDRPEIRRCPECGTYYKIENVYEWTTVGNDDDDYLTRLTPQEALELIPNAEKAELRSRRETLMECLRRCAISPKPHLAEYAKRCLK